MRPIVQLGERHLALPRRVAPSAVAAVRGAARAFLTPSAGLVGKQVGSSGRQGWIDVARGTLIVLVVIVHSVDLVAYAWLPSASTGHHVLAGLLAVLRPFRMPVFFFLSGMLATRSVGRRWRELLVRKTLLFGWVFVLWTLIHDVVLSALLSNGARVAVPEGGQEALPPVVRILLGLFVTPTYLWFLYALALYFPVVKATARFGLVPLIPGAALFLVSAQGWPGHFWNQMPSVAAYFIFFFLGFRSSSLARRWVPLSGISVVILCAVVVLAGLAMEAVIGHRSSVVLGIESLAAVMCVFVGSSVAVRVLPSACRVMSWIGSRTLPVYVIHFIVLWVGAALLTPVVHRDLLRTVAGDLAFVVLATAIATAASLGLYSVLRRPLPWLFRVPEVRRRDPTSVDA